MEPQLRLLEAPAESPGKSPDESPGESPGPSGVDLGVSGVPPSWRLDDNVRAVGRRGLAAARAALQGARRHTIGDAA